MFTAFEEKPHRKKLPHPPLKRTSPSEFAAKVLVTAGQLVVPKKEAQSHLSCINATKVEALSFVHGHEYLYREEGEQKSDLQVVKKVYDLVAQKRGVAQATTSYGHIFYRINEMQLIGTSLIKAKTTPKYTVKSLIGNGSFGSVFLAEDNNAQKVVIKSLRLFKQKYVSNAELEALVLDQIKRLPHIARPIEHYPSHNILGQDNYLIVLEHEPLGDLYEYSFKERKKIYTHQIAAFAWKMIEFLEILHANGYVHLDLKPENILFDIVPLPSSEQKLKQEISKIRTRKKDRLRGSFLKALYQTRVKVIDFGGSRSIYDTDVNRNHMTALYRDPHIVGQYGFYKEYDYFSLGVILCELYLGEGLLDVGDKIFGLLKHELKLKEPEQSFYDQLVRLHVVNYLIGIPSQKRIKEMEPNLRALYYDQKGKGFELKPISLKFSRVVEELLSAAKKNLEEALERRNRNKKYPHVHHAFKDLVFEHLLSGNQIDPSYLREHRFFKLVAIV